MCIRDRDACGTSTVTQTDGPISSTGCNRSQTRSWSIMDGCSNTATASRTVTWTVDLTPPSISATGTALFLCKPVGQDLDNALGTATGTDNCSSVTISVANSTVSVNGCISSQTRTFTATDNCGTPTITFVDGPVVTNSCSRSQTRTFTATDYCSNTATISRTVSWTVDVTTPVITVAAAIPITIC